MIHSKHFFLFQQHLFIKRECFSSEKILKVIDFITLFLLLLFGAFSDVAFIPFHFKMNINFYSETKTF